MKKNFMNLLNPLAGFANQFDSYRNVEGKTFETGEEI